MAEDRIRIVVEPDTSGFQQDLTGQLNRVDASVPVEVAVDTDEARVSIQRWRKGEEGEPVKKPVEADDSAARSTLKNFTKAASEPVRKVLEFATEQAQRSLAAFEKRGQEAFQRIAKASKVAAAAGAAAFTGAVLGSGKAFADFEQNIGGVEKLFGDAASIVQKNADAAFRSAGVSANQYMETVTGISAVLIQSLGGDTAKAAKVADAALRDMSDNANTFGTDITALQTAYAGFSRGSFVMLDNLKLGFAGSAQGAADLVNALKPAEKQAIGLAADFEATATNMTDVPFAAFSQAIGLTQERLGIMGTTAREASGTVSGSFNQMRASWTNFLTALGTDDGAAVQKATDNLLKSIGTFASNVGPLALRIGQNIGQQIAAGLGSLVGVDLIGPLSAAFAGVGAFLASHRADFEAFGAGAKDAIRAAVDFIGDQIENVRKWFDDNRESIMVYKDALARAFSEIVAAVTELATSVGGVLKTLWTTMKPVLAPLLVFVGLLVLGIAKVIPWLLKIVTVVVQIVGWLLQFKGVIALVLAAFVGMPVVIATALGLLVAYVIQNFDSIVAFLRTIPGKALGALKALGGFLMRVFRGALNLAITAAKAILNAYIAYLRAVPLRILQSIVSLGQMLWTFITNVWNKFTSITKTLVTAYIAWVRSIPGKILSAIGSVATLLYDKGRQIFEGLFDGLKAGWDKVKKWLSGIGDKIKSLKGPIEVDRTLLVDEGKAIMSGFHKGLKSKWDGVEGWLAERGGFIKGMLSKVGLSDVTDKIGSLFAGEVSVADVNATIDKHALDGMHPSSGPADTWRMAQVIAKRFGVMISSFLRPGARTTTGNLSQHAVGMAADFSNGSSPTPQMDALAEWARRLIGKAFYQVLYRTMVGGNHFNHVHIGWIPREHGGNVKRSGHYMVGEAGPEAFIPNSSGFILNNTRLDRMLNVDRRLGMLERENRRSVTPAGAQVHQEVTINMPPIQAADAQGWAMLSTNRLLEMLRANAVSLAGGVA